MKNIQHLCYLAIITIIMGLIYVSVQQVYRSTANDPQIQLAHEIVDRINKGRPIDKYFGDDTVDFQKTYSVFIETYNPDGYPIRSTALINGKLPRLPAGLINFVKTKGEDWVTWQPLPHARMAMIIVRTAKSPVAFVAVGRTLAETENRVSRLTTMIWICWLLCMAFLLISWVAQYYMSKRKELQKHSDS